MKYWGIIWVSIYWVACYAQVPTDKPTCVDKDFDKEVSRWLSFTVPLKDVKELSLDSLDDYLILDAREAEEYQVSHIPNAQHVGYSDFDISTLKKIDKKQPIIVYCSIGYRSEKIGEKLQKAGFTTVYNLYGSLFEWVNQGRTIVTPKGDTTQKIHTYNKRWSKWVSNEAYQKTW